MIHNKNKINILNKEKNEYKKVIRLNESQLNRIVKKSVKEVINNYYRLNEKWEIYTSKFNYEDFKYEVITELQYFLNKNKVINDIDEIKEDMKRRGKTSQVYMKISFPNLTNKELEDLYEKADQKDYIELDKTGIIREILGNDEDAMELNLSNRFLRGLLYHPYILSEKLTCVIKCEIINFDLDITDEDDVNVEITNAYYCVNGVIVNN